MNNLKPNTLHVDNLSPRHLSLSSGQSSACSSGSVSPVPIIPIIAISRDGDESESESEIETEPARIFHRRMSTKRNNKLVSTPVSLYYWPWHPQLTLPMQWSTSTAKFLERKLYACHANAFWRVCGCPVSLSVSVCVLVRDEVAGGRRALIFFLL